MHAKVTAAGFGWDALMWACQSGHVPVTTLLLDRGADVNAACSRGETALLIAAKWDSSELALLLISRSADLMAQDNHGRTALDAYALTEYPRPSDEVKEERRAQLRAAFAEGG